jgi:hypothetical protein
MNFMQLYKPGFRIQFQPEDDSFLFRAEPNQIKITLIIMMNLNHLCESFARGDSYYTQVILWIGHLNHYLER